MDGADERLATRAFIAWRRELIAVLPRNFSKAIVVSFRTEQNKTHKGGIERHTEYSAIVPSIHPSRERRHVGHFFRHILSHYELK